MKRWRGAWRRVAAVGAAAAAAVLATAAGCSGRSSLHASDGVGAQGGGAANDGECPERIRPVSCRAEPPECAAGQFPASDGICWTGECLDCIDGCQADDECVVVRACGCYYHEGCSWAETRFRAARLDPCIGSPDRPCSTSCSASVCGGLTCPWCDADWASCEAGRCTSVVDHVCY